MTASGQVSFPAIPAVPAIAAALGISLRTVKRYRHQALEKVGASGTADLVRVIDQSGLLPNPLNEQEDGQEEFDTDSDNAPARVRNA